MVRPYLKPEDRFDPFRGLANAMRRRLLDHLREGSKSFDDLQKIVSVRPATLAEHLTILRECGLIESRVKGGRSIYRLCRRSMNRVAEWARTSAPSSVGK